MESEVRQVFSACCLTHDYLFAIVDECLCYRVSNGANDGIEYRKLVILKTGFIACQEYLHLRVSTASLIAS